MAILDASSIFDTNRAITVTTTSGVYDVVGLGVGNPSPNVFGQTFGSATSQAQDLGGGGPLVSPPQVDVITGTAFTAGGAGTLTIQLQSAPDTSNTGTPGTWTTEVQTDALSLAQLAANTHIARLVVPVRAPGAALPRFYRLNYVVATGPMTAGTIAFAGLVTGIDNTMITSANF